MSIKNNNIQVYIVSNGKNSFTDNIKNNIKKYFNTDFCEININQINSITKNKIDLIIYEGIEIKDILYSIIDKIQEINKNLHTAICLKEKNAKKYTDVYNHHIDYIFDTSMGEKCIIAKLKTILKRKSFKYQINTDLVYKNITINRLLGEVYIDGNIVDTTRKEYKLIKLLVNKNGAFISKKEIYEFIWGYNDEDTSRIVDQYIHKIKKKIGNEVILVIDRKHGVRLI